MTPPIVTKPAETLAEQFDRLATSWNAETAHFSMVRRKMRHPAFAQLVALGPEAVPLLLRALETRPGHWYAILQEITGTNPVRPEDHGVEGIKQAWLRWGKEQGIPW